MKSFAIPLCMVAAFAAIPAASAATRAVAVAGGAFGHRLPAARLADGRISPTRGVAPAFGRRARRDGLPLLFSPAIGIGDAGLLPVEDGPVTAAGGPLPFVTFGSYDVTVVHVTPPDPTERYVGRTGATVVRTNPGPRIIYVSDSGPRRRHGRLPTVIRGISLATH